jgi:16S rRNA C967 or C1407 C5-methylase (RsmB/RsmF family)/NOL1/NOP2/fmu family ribosome biogenesis protein
VQIPSDLLNSLQDTKGFDREAFLCVHDSGDQVTSIRINPLKILKNPPFSSLSPTCIPWSQFGYYLPVRPSFTFDPLFHAGCYYVQEASSMFLEQAFRQLIQEDSGLKVLDLSAAPGGKSTHLLSLLPPDSFLVSNEVIRSRANILKDNIIKWGASNVMVTNNDPADFAPLEGYFDVIVVDAPCSGSGLFRRDPDAIEEWSLHNVALCNLRQQRILADVWPALKENGLLIYSTCSYSKEEDEQIGDWLLGQFSASRCPIDINKFPGIIESGGGYRFWPDKIDGEGFYLAAFRKTEETASPDMKVKNWPEKAFNKEVSILSHWIKKEGLAFIKKDNTVYGWPEIFRNDFSFLLNKLRVIYSGTIIGELVREKMVPDHALAMSQLVNAAVPRSDLNYQQAIQYLQRKELSLEIKDKGWQGVTYEEQLLGWINVLPNRINNYYPKELRILKDTPD